MTVSPGTLRPLPGPMPDRAGAFDLAELGYIQQEFLLAGTASSYSLTSERTTDGRWSVAPAAQAPFVTRVLLRRPADDTRYSGTVVVEWLNVSGGLDAGPDWMMAHTHLLRRGHAWAGVSAQRAGIEGGGIVDGGMHLKAAHPQRYAALSHPGDAWSFDIFSQAGRALAAHPGLSPASTSGRAPRLLASGQSQSAAFLVTYLNGIDRLAAVFDGFLVRGRPGAGAALDTGFSPGSRTHGEQIRDDVRVPVIVLQAETDVTLLGSGLAEQPDGELLRNWELAGAAHADTYLLFASGQDDGALPPARLAELIRPTADILMGRTESAVNSGLQHHYVACAAFEHLDGWVAGRAEPPRAPRLNVAAGSQDLRRDTIGVATGGIRTPWTDAPVAVLSGTGQRGEMFAFLFGTTTELSDADLARLYPGGKADYLARFEVSLDAAIEAGFLLSDDRAEILGVAAVSWPSGDSHAS